MLRKGILIALAAAAFFMLSMSVTAKADMISEAKSNPVSGGTLVTKSGKIRYQFADGTYLSDTWAYINGYVYSFKSNGYSRRNFFTYQGERYFADKNGHVLYKKWVIYKGKKYYLKEDGVKAADETIGIGGTKYVFNKNGVLIKKYKGPLPESNDEDSQTVVSSSNGAGYLFVGDSRVVGMSLSVSAKDAAYIGRVGADYSWLESTALSKTEQYLKQNPKTVVIFCFGVNDLGNCPRYITLYNKFISSHPGTDVRFMAVNPINDKIAKNEYLSNSRIKAFNKSLKGAMGTRYIDTYTYLAKKGFESSDGIHYSASTYNTIYSYVKSLIG